MTHRGVGVVAEVLHARDGVDVGVPREEQECLRAHLHRGVAQQLFGPQQRGALAGLREDAQRATRAPPCPGGSSRPRTAGWAAAVPADRHQVERVQDLPRVLRLQPGGEERRRLPVEHRRVRALGVEAVLPEPLARASPRTAGARARRARATPR